MYLDVGSMNSVSFSLEVFLLVCEINIFIEFLYVVSKKTKYMFVVLLSSVLICVLSVYRILLNETLVLYKCFHIFAMNTTGTWY
jgi:hypothetical protein